MSENRYSRRNGPHALVMLGTIALLLVASVWRAPTGGQPANAATMSATMSATMAATQEPCVKTDKKITLGFVLFDLQNPITVPMRAGAEAVAKECGFTLKLVGPQQPTAQAQIALIQDLTEQKVDGMAVIPNDATAINRSIDDAIDAKIVVATVNLDAVGSKRAFYYGPNAKKEGELQAAKAMETLHAKGAKGEVKYVITSCLPSVSGQLDRRAGFEGGVDDKVNPYAKDFQLKEIGFFDTSTDPAKNLSNIQNIYTAKPDANVIYAMCAPDTQNWGKVLKDQNNKDILIVGHDWLPGTLDLIEEGWIPWSLGESPYDMGYSSLRILYDSIANGKPLPSGVVFAASIFADKDNLADIRKSPDAMGS